MRTIAIAICVTLTAWGGDKKPLPNQAGNDDIDIFATVLLDRQEIQQALADKGYFQGPVDGAWNTGSVEALKRFQKDQNLDPDGKIGSLSLIALGLGPKRGVASAQPAPANGEPTVDSPPVAQPQQ